MVEHYLGSDDGHLEKRVEDQGPCRFQLALQEFGHVVMLVLVAEALQNLFALEG